MTRGRPAKVSPADRPPFARRLAELRSYRQLSQKQLADAIGISQSVVGDYETGKSHPSYKTLQRLSEFFGITVSDLTTPSMVIDEALSADSLRQHDAEREEDFLRLKITMAAFRAYAQAHQTEKIALDEIPRILGRAGAEWAVAVALSKRTEGGKPKRSLAECVDLVIELGEEFRNRDQSAGS